MVKILVIEIITQMVLELCEIMVLEMIGSYIEGFARIVDEFVTPADGAIVLGIFDNVQRGFKFIIYTLVFNLA